VVWEAGYGFSGGEEPRLAIDSVALRAEPAWIRAALAEADLRFSITEPEPQTDAMVLAGLALLAFIARRRARAASADA
jgi:hypothetical protein